MMLCRLCVADRHELNEDGMCEHAEPFGEQGTCTCEYVDTDPEFNDRWFASPYLTSTDFARARKIYDMSPAERAAYTAANPHRMRVDYAVALIEADAAPVVI